MYSLADYFNNNPSIDPIRNPMIAVSLTVLLAALESYDLEGSSSDEEDDGDDDEVLTSTDISSLTDEDEFVSDNDDNITCSDEENKKLDLEQDVGNKKDTNDGMESKYDSESTDSELEERRMRKRSLRREFELEYEDKEERANKKTKLN